MKLLPFESKHFQLFTLADGVFAAIGKPAGGAFSNAGIINLGDHTLIFDTFMTQVAAEDLLKACLELTKKFPTWVINSHAHSDHCCGNQIFSPQATIISTKITRELMPRYIQYLLDYQKDIAKLDQEIEEDRKSLMEKNDIRWQASLESYIPRMAILRKSLPYWNLVLPHQTYVSKLVFYGSQRIVELHTSGKGHTDSDAFLILPEDQIAFIGDLGFFQTQPFMASSTPIAWQDRMDELIQMDVDTYVPGHGPVGSVHDIELQKEYITLLTNLVQQAVKEQLKPSELIDLLPLESPMDSWLMGGMLRLEANIDFLYDLNQLNK